MRTSFPHQPLILLLALWCCVQPAFAAPSDDEIEAAIVRMQNWLLRQQNAERGNWEKSPPPSADVANHERSRTHGQTLMATYALLGSGWSPQEERLAKALRFLRENEPWGTYGTSVRSHIWALLPDAYLPNLQRDAEWLLKAQNGGLWDYGPVRRARVDHSTTQYGVLGLWEFAKRGGRTPDKVWQDAMLHFIDYQGKDGGWAYSAKGDVAGQASGSMTAAGLTVLYIGIQQLYTNREVPPAVLDALARGHAWLDRHFTADKNPQPPLAKGRGHDWYYLYCIERVALASGVKTFGGVDWFEAGAARILKAEGGRGHVAGVVDTSFCLMFLARGRVPVWINKIQLAKGDWNNRPNDIYNVNAYLGDLREGELNWQVIDLDTPASSWINAPIAWLSSDDPVELTDAQRGNLKRYLDLGGVLVANPEGSGTRFTNSIRGLARAMYPDLSFAPMPADHAATSMLTPTGATATRGIQVLNNGVRDLVILLGQDWGRNLQTDRQPGESDAWGVMTNLYGVVTERGRLDNRLVPRIEPRRSRAAKGDIAVARARYDGGQWDIERQAWEPLKPVLFNHAGFDIDPADIPLAETGSSKVALLHLAGVDAVELSDSEKESIKRFVEGGGTLLVETVGGRGDFSVKIEEQLRDVFATESIPLANYDPLVTGQGLEGGKRITRVLFRQFSVLNMAAKRDVRMAAFRVGDRPGVIITHDDLSMGALGVKRWGINGYQPDVARDLLTNILLTARKHRK